MAKEYQNWLKKCYMNKKFPVIYFVYAVFAIGFFLWLIFGLTLLIASLITSTTLGLIFLILIPAIISAIAILLAFSAASPLINDFMVSFRRLFRIDNLSNPLLLKLSLNAPGTYHHSINVSNIAQKAAKAVGADSLLVRVAAYYHDIGKLDNPEFFLENQPDNQSPTQEPQKAAKIIISHVTDGVKMAKANHLTDEICDLISEHHGTTLVNYFFDVAQKTDGKTLREDYRYPGPKPSSKESGILMLADSAEAAIRSIKNISKETITEYVQKVIHEKIESGQLENCGLSDKDLNKIKISLIDTLNVIYHRRIVR